MNNIYILNFGLHNTDKSDSVNYIINNVNLRSLKSTCARCNTF